MLPVWVLVLAGVTISGAGTIESFYDTEAERAELLRSMTTNGSLRAMYGPLFSDSVGGLVAWRFGGFSALMAAVMSLLIVIRHTRDEEESGRQEMLSAAVVGRRAPLTAALLTALIANTGIALLIAIGLAGPGGSAAGALALGLSIGGIGMLFATMAALMAQLTESARLARGLTAAALGGAYALRAAGDAATHAGSSPLTWLSPLGWAEHIRPFGATRWWVLALLAAAVLVQGALAYALAGRRDVGMSFLPTRPGPAAGRLTTTTQLAWRLQRGALLGWAAGFLLAGLAFGSMADGAAELVGENEDAREIFQRMGGQSGLTSAFLAAIVGICAMVAALHVVSAVLRLHGEETAQRAEPVLANAVGRLPWAAGHLTIAFGGAIVILSCLGLGLAIGHGDQFGPILGAALAQLPAVWLLGSVAVLLYGVFPRAAAASWGVAGACLAIGWIGPALDLPSWVLDLSPFGQLPKLPGGSLEWAPILVLTALAIALTSVGLAGLRRRDLQT
ncbi:ABC transporter permease [Streptomyces sp. CWNU-1]|uniref:ABC transporter permease n=2 Tax=Streptomyces albipurpureus TaxID=2897419 RepID=A0ABT0USF2_9ACTN|nr:ABC transporter permease [Streptomyces sp. CWNU-1]MCM2391277.1 ABC transporter permease [Streptomyces sp. CWNU-1]